MLEVPAWEVVWNVRIFKGFFVYLFVYYFVLDRPQFTLTKLYNIRVLLNLANCWNFHIGKRNLDRAVSASTNCLFFYDLLIIIFVWGKPITIINVVGLHFLTLLRQPLTTNTAVVLAQNGQIFFIRLYWTN